MNPETPYSNGHAAAILAAEMRRWGISRARLVRRAGASQVTETRVREALTGNPGAGRRCWNEAMLRDWSEMIRTAFTF